MTTIGNKETTEDRPGQNRRNRTSNQERRWVGGRPPLLFLCICDASERQKVSRVPSAVEKHSAECKRTENADGRDVGMPENLVKRGVKFGRSCLGRFTHAQFPALAIFNFNSAQILADEAKLRFTKIVNKIELSVTHPQE